MDMCWCTSFVSFFSSFVVLSFRDLFVECLKVDGVRPCFVEALAVGRCAVDASVRAEGCIVDVKALFYSFGYACCAFVLFLGSCFGGYLCRGMFGLFLRCA